jgi:general secretion pathway protein D
MIKVYFNLIFIFLFSVPCFAVNLDVEDMPIVDALAMITEITSVNYSFTGEVFNVDFTVKNISKSKLNVEFERYLNGKGFDVVRDGSVRLIVGHGLTYSDKNTLCYRVQWLDAETLKTTITDIWKDSISVGVSDNVLILSGDSHSINSLVSKLQKYDAPFDENIIVFRLKYISSTDFINAVSKDENLKDVVQGDSWSNSVIVKGNKYVAMMIDSYVKSLDVKNDSKDYEIIQLFNFTPENIITAVTPLISGASVVAAGSTKIIISGTPYDVERLSKIVRSLDGKMCQIQINAVVAILTDSQYKELGTKVSYLDSSATYTAGIVKSIYDPSLLFDVLTGSFGLDVSAVEGKASDSILSEPSILVTNGTQAKIYVGQEVPVQTSETVSDEGEQTTTTVERQEVGISLTVTPTVKDNFISIVLEQEISSVDSTTSSGDYVFNTETISSTLLMANGQTTIVGGLKVYNTDKSSDKVPFLSSIPFVGGLFGYDSDSDERRNVVVSLTAQIIEKS